MREHTFFYFSLLIFILEGGGKREGTRDVQSRVLHPPPPPPRLSLRQPSYHTCLGGVQALLRTRNSVMSEPYASCRRPASARARHNHPPNYLPPSPPLPAAPVTPLAPSLPWKSCAATCATSTTE